MSVTNYLPGDYRPINPRTGRPADYYFLSPVDGTRLHRWRRGKKFARVVDELLKEPSQVFMGVAEAAELLGLSKTTIRNYIERGALRATRPTHRYLINGADLNAFARSTRGVVGRPDLEAAL